MPETGAATLDLPPELWMRIHRLATSHLSPLTTVYAGRDTPEESESQLSSFLMAAGSLGRVCRLWKELAQELMYENIRITEWASLSAALDRPELARRVRSIRLSTTRDDHSATALIRCPQVEVILRPRGAPSASALSPGDFELPPLPALKRLYWTQTSESCTLLQNVVRAAPNLEHLSLSADPKLGANLVAATMAFETPSRPRSISLGARGDLWVPAIMRADLSRLSHLAMDYMSLESFHTPLPTLQILEFMANPIPPSRVYSAPLHLILRRYPNLRELRYDVRGQPIAPQPQQVATALSCVHLVRPWPNDSLGPSKWSLATAGTALEQLLGSAFPALERIVLDGPGWQAIDCDSWDSVMEHRLRGRRVERG
ncbi:hypothetical protein C8R46DRAFT_952995 [Mycena filopes]|nr:hypothetical protein C8R46DRAFT_952995 [Mycena filopes]